MAETCQSTSSPGARTVYEFQLEEKSLFKVCALLSTTPAETCLTDVMMLYRVIWFGYRASKIRKLVSYSSRSVLNVLQKTFLTLFLVELRYLVE